MATAVLIHPVDAKYHAIDEQLTVERGKLEREIHRDEQHLQVLHDALVARWGTSESDRRRVENRGAFDVAERQYAQNRAVIRARISTTRGLLEDLDVRREIERRRAREETYVGPAVVVTMPAIPMAATDRRLSTLNTKRAATAASLTECRARIDDLGPLVEEDRGIVEALDARLRLGLVDGPQVAAAKSRLAAEQTALSQARTAEADLVHQLDALDGELDERRRAFRIEEQAVVDRELATASAALADAVFRAMQAATVVERLNGLSTHNHGADCVVPWLSADSPRSWSREYLQSCIERGWRPATK